MKFKPDKEGNTPPIVTRDGKDLIIEVPSFALIAKNLKEHGKRNIQSI